MDHALVEEGLGDSDILFERNDTVLVASLEQICSGFGKSKALRKGIHHHARMSVARSIPLARSMRLRGDIAVEILRRIGYDNIQILDRAVDLSFGRLRAAFTNNASPFLRSANNIALACR